MEVHRFGFCLENSNFFPSMPVSLTGKFISQQKIGHSFQTRVLLGTLELRFKILPYCCGLEQDILLDLLRKLRADCLTEQIDKMLARE